MAYNFLWRWHSDCVDQTLYGHLLHDTSQLHQSHSLLFPEELIHCFLHGRFSTSLPSWTEEEERKGEKTATKVKGSILKTLNQHYFESPCLVDIYTPPQFMIKQSTVPGHTYGLFTTQWIKEKANIGPFTGKIVLPHQLPRQGAKDHIWDVFDENGLLAYFIDARYKSHENWICYINCARNEEEQNLDLVQSNNSLYYRTNKDIPPGHELLVWYANSNQLFLGIPEERREKGTLRKTRGIEHHLLHANTKCTFGRLKCTICRRAFNSRSNLRSHMRIHTLEKPFRCKYCRRCFSQSSTLRNHTRLHTGEKPYRCHVCRMAYSQLAGLRAHQKSAKHKR